jgi:hypothetical protein
MNATAIRTTTSGHVARNCFRQGFVGFLPGIRTGGERVVSVEWMNVKHPSFRLISASSIVPRHAETRNPGARVRLPTPPVLPPPIPTSMVHPRPRQPSFRSPTTPDRPASTQTTRRRFRPPATASRSLERRSHSDTQDEASPRDQAAAAGDRVPRRSGPEAVLQRCPVRGAQADESRRRPGSA